VLLKMFLLFRLRPDGAELEEFLAQYEVAHAENLRRYEAKIVEVEKSGAPDAELVRYGLLHERAVLEWIAGVRKRLKPRRTKRSAIDS